MSFDIAREKRASELRARAEAALRKRTGVAAEPSAVSPEGRDRLLHELWVHQVELEMQNEELRQAQQDLALSRDRYADLYDHAPVGYVTLSKQGLVLRANVTAMDMLGVERSGLLRHPFSKLVAPEDRDRYYACHNALYGGAGPQTCDVTLLRSDGERFIARLQTRIAVDDDAGECSRVAIGDITEHKRAEERLRQVQRMEALGQMAGGVAHEFNNLLTTIGGFAQMGLEQANDAESVRTALEKVLRAAERAADLTGQILAFSRKKVVDLEVVPPREAIARIETLLRSCLDADVELHIEPGHTQACVEVDPNLLSEALVNLAVNAGDAMPGGGTLTIGCDSVDFAAGFTASHGDRLDPGRYLRIAVADQGSGMDRTTLAHIFEPFFTTKDVGQGSGLGLSMVYGMVAGAGGAIDVDTALGVGTTFSIYLPVVDKVPTEAAVRPPDAPAPRGGGETVLVVEDDAQVRDLVRGILEGQGFVVLAASDSRTAIEAFERHGGRVAVLVTDLVMPGTGGAELAAALCARDPELRVVYMTGYARESIETLRGLGPECSVLQKPFRRQALLQTVRRLLDATAGRRAV